MRIESVVETEGVIAYLRNHGLLDRYQKAKRYILLGLFNAVAFKKRQPKTRGVWYFRLSEKYRAYAFVRGTTLFVFHIDDHQ